MWDHGLFFSMAQRLSRDAKKVYYGVPNDCPFPIPNASLIGDGFENVERVKSLRVAADVYCFPDIGMSHHQMDLGAMNKPVFGSFDGDQIELGRLFFKKLQGQLGMNVPPHQVVTGLTELRDFLKNHGECYIKISRWRGLMETFHHVDFALTEPWLDALQVRLGPLKDEFLFIVEEPIKAVIELGIDTLNVRGRFPKTVVQAKEGKDKCCISTVIDYADLEPGFLEMHEKLKPWFEQVGYQGWFSSEGRMTEDGQWFMTDPTCRQATPCGEPVQEMMANYSEVVNGAAHGELVEPEYEHKFGVQALVDHNGDEENYRTIRVPADVEQWVKLYTPIRDGDLYHIPPFSWSTETIGSVVGVGDTLKAAYEHLLKTADALKDQPVSIKTNDIAEVLAEIEAAEEHGVEFTDQSLPEPKELVET